MGEVSVTIEFPSEKLALRFLQWLDMNYEDAGLEFQSIAALEGLAVADLTFAIDPDKFFCRVTPYEPPSVGREG